MHHYVNLKKKATKRKKRSSLARIFFVGDSILSLDKCCYPMPIAEDYVKTARKKRLQIFSISKIRRVVEHLTHHAAA